MDYLFGLARNERVQRRIKRRMKLARRRFAKSGAAARVSADFRYRTRRSWAQQLYETIYCARGEMENRIKEQQLGLFADRTSTAEFRSNQIRLYFSSIGYCVLEALRRLGLAGTKMARAQCTTIRLRLLKIGARIRITARKVWISLATGYPWAGEFEQVYANLERARQGRQSRFGQKRTKNLSARRRGPHTGLFPPHRGPAERRCRPKR